MPKRRVKDKKDVRQRKQRMEKFALKNRIVQASLQRKKQVEERQKEHALLQEAQGTMSPHFLNEDEIDPLRVLRSHLENFDDDEEEELPNREKKTRLADRAAHGNATELASSDASPSTLHGFENYHDYISTPIDFLQLEEALERNENVYVSKMDLVRELNTKAEGQPCETRGAAHHTSLIHILVKRVVTYLEARKREIADEDHRIRQRESKHAPPRASKQMPHRENPSMGGIQEEQEDEEEDVRRDSGYIPCKVLILLPTRNFAFQFLLELKNVISRHFGHSLPDGVSVPKWEQLVSEYGTDDTVSEPSSFQNRPLDYRALFAGNLDDRFCLGVTMSRLWNQINLYTKYLKCDMILASPLGLAHYTGIADAESTTSKEASCKGVLLSSIEVFVAYPLDVLMMQNWQRVLDTTRTLNQPVQRSSTADLGDFRRLRECFMNGTAMHYRQNILVSSFQHAFFTALFREVCVGTYQSQRCFHESYEAVPGNGMLRAIRHDAFTGIQGTVKQYFIRVDETNLTDAFQERLTYFTSKFYPSKIAPLVHMNTPVILFVPSYFDFVAIRAHFEEHAPHSYNELCEYTPVHERKHALYEFTSRKRTFIIMTERFYFYYRRYVRGAVVLVFYAPPLYTHFYPELVNRMNIRDPTVKTMVLFSKFNSHELFRLVGYQNACDLLDTETSPSNAVYCL